MNVSKEYVNSKAQDISPYTGKDVVVGLIDSGIRQDHPDLFPSGSTVVLDQIRCTSSSCTSDGTYGDSGSGNADGHGTPNAGIIAGRGTINSDLKGIAPEAKLVNIKILDLDETSFPKALDWLVTNHPEAKAVNVSLGDCENSGQNTILGHIADQAVNLGNDLVYVGSAGNNDGSCPVNSPLVSPPATGYNVISVGNWFYNNGNPTIVNSQHGPLLDGRIKPELVASGSGIYAPSLTTLPNYKFFTGTSFAAPFVTGAVAILKEANPNLTPLETKSALLAGANWGIPLEYTANDYDDCVDTNMSWICEFDVNKRGFGLLDVAKSLEITNNQNILKDTIAESGDITNEYALSVTKDIPTKVILTWFHIPNGDDFANLSTGILGDLTLEILDQDNNIIKTSSSDTQNIEFTIFIPDVTSDNWKIRISSENNFNPLGTVIDYAIAHTQFDFSIPSWIKEHAKEWSANKLSDDQYASNIEFLSNAGIINIDATSTGNDPNIPSWIKDNAEWWSQGLITDREHADALQYLVEKGIITLGISVESSTIQSLLTLSEQTDTYVPNSIVTITPVSDPSRGCEPNCYAPSVVTVDAGTTIIFSNIDDLPHSFTSGTPYTGPDGSWNSGIVFGGEQYSVTLNNPGTYNYYSLFDSWMQGTIIVNDPASPPTSNGGTISALRDIPVSITLSASSENTETLDFIIVSNPTGGILDYTTQVPNDTPTSATVTYTSQSSFSGTDSFSFQTRDESGELSDVATITIDVSIPDTERPTANSQEISVIENFDVPIILTGFDPEGRALTFSILSSPLRGTLSDITQINDNTASIVFTPLVQGFSDKINFQFRATTATQASNAATVTINVNAHPNTAPVASPDTANIPEDTASYSINVLNNDYDEDIEFYGDELFVHSIDSTSISGGTATISADLKSISFTPDANFDGDTTLSYIIRDSSGAQSNSADITINMIPNFDAPESAPDSTTVGVDSASNTINPLVNDSDVDTGDILSISSIDTTATSGTAQISNDGLSILFTPESGFAGDTTLSYVTQDLAANPSDESVITINVSPSEGKALYVASRGTNEIIAFAPDGSFISEHVTDELSSPWGVAVSPDGNYIYVSSYTTNKILKYDRATGAHIESFTNNAESTISTVSVFAHSKQDGIMTASLQPQNELLTANNDISYNTLSQDVSSVLVYDDTTGDYIGEFTREQSIPDELSIDEYTNSVSVTDSDGITHEFVNAAFSGLSSPRNIEFGPDGNLYISSLSNNKVVRLDVSTEQYDDFATSGFITSPAGLAWGPHDSNLYVVSSGNGKVLKFDGTTGQYDSEFIDSISTSKESVWGPDGNLYVTSTRNGQILAYDDTASQIRTIDTSADGWVICKESHLALMAICMLHSFLFQTRFKNMTHQEIC